MNSETSFKRMRKGLVTGLGSALLALAMVGCSADSNDPTLPGNGGGGGGGGGPNPATTENCAVPVSTLCVLGGSEHGHGLVDELLSPNGPLGPIAGALDAQDLTNALQTLLENDDGSLTTLLTDLFVNGQLQEGLTALLLPNEAGEGGLANILQNLLMGSEEGQGLLALVQDDVPGLLQALLLSGSEANCQAPLGTLCLIAGEGSDQVGLVDLLLTSEGLLGALSPTLGEDVTDDVVALLGDLLESNGALADLVSNLFAGGHLAEGLQALLIGDPEGGIPSGLLAALENTFSGLGDILGDIGDFVGNLLGLGGGGL